MEASSWVIDVDGETFEEQVLTRSKTTPVVVDFWAPWCAPCRSLGPLLERLAEEHAGAFVLARVDIDQNAELAARFAVRSIPAVLGIAQGEIRGQFLGAQPEPMVRRFLDEILPSEADQQSRRGTERAEAGDSAGAEASFEAALALDDRQPAALLGLARIHAARDEVEEAQRLLDRIPATTRLAVKSERLAAELRTRAAGSRDEHELRALLAAEPSNLALRLDLGRILAASERYEEALSELLQVVQEDPAHDDEAARRLMLDVFEVLGPTDPVTERFRRELARALFR